MTAGEQLREAFLRGEEVIGIRFAVRCGVNSSAISKALREFGSLVASREEWIKGDQLRRQKIWRCVNLEGMSSWQPPKPGKAGRPKKVMKLDALAEAWGMRMADIPLPTTTHEMRGAWE